MSSMKDFEVLSLLGSGSFASVHKVKRISDGQLYAMKKVKLPSLSPKEKENALNEIRILASINDRNIVAYKQAFYDDSSKTLNIIMEYASGGDLLNKINDHKKKNTSVPEETVWSYLIQMAQGLRTLHNMKILHRDLKCANIFLGTDGKTIKLGDLNVSKVAQKGLAHTQAGTPYYASPEVWQDKPYGAKSDVWSIGCVLYELCALQPPFRANDMKGLFNRITKGVYDRIPTYYSAELARVIGMCLKVQPNDRPTCEKLLSEPSVAARMTDMDTQNLKKNLPLIQDLISTIKMPRNMRDLSNMLPKSKYHHSRDYVSMCDLDAPLSLDDESKRHLAGFVSPSRFANKKDPRENSIERILGEKKPQDQLKKVLPVVPVRQEKVTSIQRAGNGVVGMEGYREGYRAAPIAGKGGMVRAMTPTLKNKGNDVYSVDPRENERLARKEYNLLGNNVNQRRNIRPLY